MTDLAEIALRFLARTAFPSEIGAYTVIHEGQLTLVHSSQADELVAEGYATRVQDSPVWDHHIAITAKGQEWAQVDAARPGVKQMGPGVYRG